MRNKAPAEQITLLAIFVRWLMLNVLLIVAMYLTTSGSRFDTVMLNVLWWGFWAVQGIHVAYFAVLVAFMLWLRKKLNAINES